MTLKFHMTPGSCTTGIHILLEELELPFEVNIVNLPAGDHQKPAYLAINPKGTIPTLVLDDGSALTSFQSIAYWLARRHPRKRLLSDDPFLAARTLDLLDYAVNTVHGQGFTRIFTTDVYLPESLGPHASPPRGSLPPRGLIRLGAARRRIRWTRPTRPGGPARSPSAAGPSCGRLST
ncbi:glutathione S-transferase N-terminal domain-containing protein [Hydrogenophaga sp. SL48]|uniref:glutathione S-transferase N-terminal domain-containing protein n=1 Tax=Hydrogenophaga sp. SL48 TaxID=2806347 RepID=UPI001EFFFE50|nr:glutathione S-transferase N-terminal domain-containing protein [Hydrogenophaga sp. SL48]UJW82554.1 glutathione S-transferase N-terminal domain-containing protein [Hydrogenophaga sp. SL48]